MQTNIQLLRCMLVFFLQINGTIAFYMKYFQYLVTSLPFTGMILFIRQLKSHILKQMHLERESIAMNTTKQQHLYTISTIIIWAISYPVTKLALMHFDPLPLAGVRYLLASLILLLFVPKMRKPEKSDWPWFFLSGCCGFSVYMMFFNTGIQSISSATTSVIIALSPVITALLARVFYHEQLKGYQWGSMVICFFGVLVLTVLEQGMSMGSGILWVLGAAFCVSCYNILQRKMTKKYTAMESTTYSILMGTLGLLFFAPAGVDQLMHAPINQWVNVLALALGCSVIGYVLWSKALSMTKKTSSVTNYMFLTPFISAIGGYILLSETLSIGTIIGGCIILLGLAMFNFGGKFVK